MVATEKEVFQAIAKVMDPELGFDLVSLGLIYGVTVKGQHVDVQMTLSSRGCPLHEMMVTWVREAVERMEQVTTCTVEVIWEPAWNISMAAGLVRTALGG